MIRATATMQQVRAALDLSAKGYDCDDRLRELSYGDWEGLTSTEMQTRDPELVVMRGRDKWHTAPPGGESYAALSRRVAAWHSEVTRDTVVTAHGGPMRVLIALAGIAEPADAADHRVEQGVVYAFAYGTMSKHG